MGDKILIGRSTLICLKYSLIWPSEEDEMAAGVWYYLRIVLFVLITIPWCLMVFMHLVMTLKNNTGVDISEDVALVVAYIGVYYMVANHVKHQKDIAILLKDLSTFTEFGKPPGFDSTNQRLSFWSRFFFGYCIVGVISYNGMKYLLKADCERVNEQLGLQEVCGFLSKVWVPFDIGPYYYLVLLYIFIATQVVMKLSLMISFMSLEMAQNIIMRIEHLNGMIRACFGDDADYEICRRRMRRCHLYHLEILDFAARLDRYFSQGMFAHLAITGAICGCIENQLVKTDEKLGPIIHVFGWICALFVACLGGQNLLNASMTIPDAIFQSQWYRVDVRLRKDLLFILRRSQKGLYVRAGPFGVLSFPLFVAVMKMSYSILAMLKS